MSERAVRGWSRDQTGQVIAAVAAADSHTRVVVVVVGAVDSHILIVALGNQYIVLACGVVGSLWLGYPLGRAADRTRRVDNWQTDTMPAPVGGIAAAAVAGHTAGCIRWDLCLRNRSTAAAAAAVAASQRSIAVTREREEAIRHLGLGSEKRRWLCDL